MDVTTIFFDELQAISKKMDSIKYYSSVNKKIRKNVLKLQQTSAKKINKTSPPAILNNGASEDQSGYLNEETVIRNQIEDLPQPTEQSHLSLTNRVPITSTEMTFPLSDKELRHKEDKLRPQATNTANHPHKYVTTTPPTENATSNMATSPVILNSTDTSELLNTVSEIKRSQQELQTEPEKVSSTLYKEQDSTNKVKKSIPDKEVPNVDRNQISQEVIRPGSNTEDYPTNKLGLFLELCQNIQRIT
ncbi:unnamed protein product [Mytilus edulis]|uniref:Uncharacterized protein n=1 Tax=Mytilus edulis TaxID=6550 RepID=A0A8S3TE79_MYTED|nr:unnamed protein product [Mytilus edulis]